MCPNCCCLIKTKDVFDGGDMTKAVNQQRVGAAFVLSNEALSC